MLNSVLPFSYQPTKSDYKKYLKDGGSLSYVDFKLYERRDALKIVADKINTLHSAMISAYKQAMYYKSVDDNEGYELNMVICDVRSSQLSIAHKEHDNLIK
jgi:hypothetical protein